MAYSTSEDIFEKAMVSPIGMPKALSPLFDELLPRWQAAAVAQEQARQQACRVDGCIIGTGEADFTKGNTTYTLTYKEKSFQLMDVPGIEGDESKYTEFVRQAVAKAHLVFYVNGTNKKPEVKTVQKIRNYLRRGTQVYSVVNVRGNADAYEFEEDRVPLDQQDNSLGALKQTMGVLSASLSREILLGGQCVQGLLAFSALAVDSSSKRTSIHPMRDRDLVVQQRNYLKCFGSPKAMYEFSQVRQLALVLQSKIGTFREDIVESNKSKVRELIQENISILERSKKSHLDFLSNLRPDFEKCRDSLERAARSFENKVESKRHSLWNQFFSEFSSDSKDVIERNFGEDDEIDRLIRQCYRKNLESLECGMNEMLKECLVELQNELQDALKRMLQNVQKIDMLSRSTSMADLNKSLYLGEAELEMGLGIKGWGKIAFQVGSYAASGAAIGSVFPGLGNLLGGALGAIVGLVMAVVGWFSGKEKRIRKAQSQLGEKIESMREDAMETLRNGNQEIFAMIRKDVVAPACAQVDELDLALRKPVALIERQIEMMNHIKQRLQEMPHGTIQAI